MQTWRTNATSAFSEIFLQVLVEWGEGTLRAMGWEAVKGAVLLAVCNLLVGMDFVNQRWDLQCGLQC
jgi:hypothetical protein